MIDFQQETLVTIQQAATLIEKHFGSRISYAGILRWCREGKKVGGRRIRLEVIGGPGPLRTSAEALQRFFEETAAPARTDEAPQAATRRGAKQTKLPGPEWARNYLAEHGLIPAKAES
jgi:hypothetical protein